MSDFAVRSTTFYDAIRYFSTPHCTGFARSNGLDPQRKSGTWRVQVRRKGRSISETFVRHDDAKRRGVNAERQIDRGETPTLSRIAKLQSFADLVDLHITDMKEVGKPPADRS
ncbi:MAG TPA: hypothetical protein VGG92_13910 [Caulobacteraceae bacterium]|jgi:hypothetical protein